MAGVVTLGLVLFGLWWHGVEVTHYDDSDPEAAVGEGVILLCLPGAMLVVASVLARAFGRPSNAASWRLVGWGVTVCHSVLALVVGLAIWWGWSGRINEGDPAYEGAVQHAGQQPAGVARAGLVTRAPVRDRFGE